MAYRNRLVPKYSVPIDKPKQVPKWYLEHWSQLHVWAPFAGWFSGF